MKARYIAALVLVAIASAGWLAAVNAAAARLTLGAGEPTLDEVRRATEYKRHVVLPGGHFELSFQHRSQLTKEMLDWLDRYMGPVQH